MCLEVNLKSFIHPKFVSGLHIILMMIILCVPPFSKTISLTNDCYLRFNMTNLVSTGPSPYFHGDIGKPARTGG